jgi:HlyD family secretion protein
MKRPLRTAVRQGRITLHDGVMRQNGERFPAEIRFSNASHPNERNLKLKKILIIVAIVLVVVAAGGFYYTQSQKGVVTVQTGPVVRQSVKAIVSGSGEIRPKTFVNIGANAFGKITRLYVREGDKVKQGQVLAQLENVQSSADVAANAAALNASRSDVVAAQAAMNRAKSDVERTKLDYDRADGLFKAGLIPKAEYDSKKTAYEGAAAAMQQNRAMLQASTVRVTQQEATLRRVSDVLGKTSYIAPFDGTVTNLPVREGETVVIGIQNSPGSTLMTLADMSTITAEVKIDETDIVNVHLEQPAEVTIDAFPKQTFHGHVSEIGDNAVLRSTGIASTQTTSGSQEAKDFKVVVKLDDPPANLRPGLSATAKITTAVTPPDSITIPIQALTVRQKIDLKPETKDGKAKDSSMLTPEDKEEIQGVFVVEGKKARFLPVKTGVAGATDIVVTDGLKVGDTIVVGSYKVLRTMKNNASVKVDNSVPKRAEDES